MTAQSVAARDEQRSRERELSQQASNASLTITERVLLAIQSYGVDEPRFSLEELMEKAKLQRQQIYSAMYRMRDEKVIEIMTETVPGSGAKRIYGARLLKQGARPTPQATVRPHNVPRSVPRPDPVYAPLTRSYMRTKEVVEDARAALTNVGLDADATLVYQPDPLGDEAISLYNLAVEGRREIVKLLTRIEQQERELEGWRREQAHDTVDDTVPEEPASVEVISGESEEG